MTLDWLNEQISQYGIPAGMAEIVTLFIFFLFVSFFAVIATAALRKTIVAFIIRWIEKKYQWGAPLVHNNFFIWISWFVPLAIFSNAIDSMLDQSGAAHLLAQRLIMSCFVIVAVLSASSLLSSMLGIESLTRKTKRSMLQGYVDGLKIVSYVLGAIFIISIFTGRSPWGVLSILGGLTAVILLIFKDTILGFVASLQIGALDLVRVGDWIEMPQYGADGDVISISIHTVKVQNFDKTITTIPTYAMVSSSFKNWRGMQESQGRRIKRPLLIDLHSIRFCDEEMLSRCKEIEILKEYLENKEKEIEAYNATHFPKASTPLSGRRQTNVGVFRAYIVAYLKKNANINPDMTFLVRQLPPTDHGLPIEVYVFSKDQKWANYEAIQADIFDHLLAAAPEFGLRLFQLPSGYDLRSLSLMPAVDGSVMKD